MNLFRKIETKSTSVGCELHPNGSNFMITDFFKI